jgi:hypothetical protein
MPRLLRGAIPTPRNLLAGATPHVAVEPTPPQFLWLPTQVNMWGNATFGDCVSAEEAFAKACHQPEIYIPAAEVIRWARKHYVLNGAGLWYVLTLMQEEGFNQNNLVYNDGPFKSVDWEDEAVLRNAIAKGPVKVGVDANQLEETVQAYGVGKNGWFATGYSKGGPLDHCTSVCGYGPCSGLATQLGGTLPPDLEPGTPAYAMFTWCSIGIIDVPSLLAICGEAWLRTPTTIVAP